ncbi:MAG: hypothetical protein KatS3mg109_0896 [Pirellulaceae bacterium]|nr:MAG: hypothetical protein KatS3mg109_0896 [Pirellulaceae bacterium]
MFFLQLSRVNTFDAEGLQEPAHIRVALAVAQVPELDGKLAAEMPDQIDAHPDAGEVLQSAAGDDDAALLGVGVPARLEAVGERLGHATVGLVDVGPPGPASRPGTRRGVLDQVDHLVHGHVFAGRTWAELRHRPLSVVSEKGTRFKRYADS